jgi:hypothetical protein
MEKSRRPNVIRTWVVNRNQAHCAHGRRLQPAMQNKKRANVSGTFSPRGATLPANKGNS